MIIIRPLEILDAMLVDSNVAEPFLGPDPAADPAEWLVGTPYVQGDEVRVTAATAPPATATHLIYTAQGNTTGDDPTIDDGTNWKVTDATNRWRAFNEVLQQPTSNPESITYEILPGERINAIALLGLVSQTVRIRMNDPVDGDVYDETFDTISFSGITDWYSYYYEPIVGQANVIRFDLPAFPAATLFVTITNTGGTAEVGEIVIGNQFLIGDTIYGASFSIADFSEKTTDELTGAVTITEGPFQNLGDFDVKIETSRFGEIRGVLTSLRATPIVWVADPNDPDTGIYGYPKNFDIIISGPTVSDTLLEIEGLI